MKEGEDVDDNFETGIIEEKIYEWFDKNVPDVDVDRISSTSESGITTVDLRGDVDLADLEGAPEYIVIHSVSGNIVTSGNPDVDVIARIFNMADDSTIDMLPDDVKESIDEMRAETSNPEPENISTSYVSDHKWFKHVFEGDDASAGDGDGAADDKTPDGSGNEDAEPDGDKDDKDDSKDDEKDDNENEEDVPISGIKITFKDDVDIDGKVDAMKKAGIPKDMMDVDDDEHAIVVNFNGDEELLDTLKTYLKDNENIDLEEEIGGEISGESDDDDKKKKTGEKGTDDTDGSENGDLNNILDGIMKDDATTDADGSTPVKDDTNPVK